MHEAEVCGLPDEFSRSAVRNFGDMRRAGEGDVAEAVFAGDYQRPLRTELGHCAGQERSQLRAASAENLVTRAGRIRERAENVEDRANAELLANGGDMLHRWMSERREAEANAKLVEAGFDLR